MNQHPLTSLFGYFALLSLFAVGGANAAIPEMHRVAVEVMRWMSDRQFADMYAIAQMSPGPNVIIVALIGYHVAGFAGAGVAITAMCGPTCMLAFLVARTWDRFKEARWRMAIQAGMVPLSLGLIAASAFVLARAADHNVYAVLITVVTAAVAFFTRINPLWVFVAAGVLGLVRLALTGAGAGHGDDAGEQNQQLNAEDGDVGVPPRRDQWHRRLERLVSVVVIGGAAVDRHGDQGREEGGVNDRSHERDQIEPLHRHRARATRSTRRRAGRIRHSSRSARPRGNARAASISDWSRASC